MTRCTRCGRLAYRGTLRVVEPVECPGEDGASCRAYRLGVSVGSEELRETREQLRRCASVAQEYDDSLRAAKDEIPTEAIDALIGLLPETLDAQERNALSAVRHWLIRLSSGADAEAKS